VFSALARENFDVVVSIEFEGMAERYDLEELCKEFPFIRFVLLREKMNIGQAVNLASREVKTPLFFILWNDLRIIHSGGAPRMAELALRKNEKGVLVPRRLCTVPMFQDNDFQTIPTLSSPVLRSSSLDFTLSTSTQDGAPTLFPFDGVGIYAREAFLNTGGFDSKIETPHWQLADFGFRAWLWGEEIACTQFVRLNTGKTGEPRSTTADSSYRRFFLKNLALKLEALPQAEDRAKALEKAPAQALEAHLPLRAYLPFMLRSKLGPLETWHEFKSARAWVEENHNRFKKNLSDVTATFSP
jgi:hypothetical protein